MGKKPTPVPDIEDMMRKNQPRSSKETGNRLSEILADRNMTQQELSDLSGIQKTHINEIVKGKRKQISLQVAMRIAKVLNEPVENIFTVESNGKEKEA